jgi:hypothetical protein
VLSELRVQRGEIPQANDEVGMPLADQEPGDLQGLLVQNQCTFQIAKILMNAGISGNALTADKLAKLKPAVGEVTAAAPADLKAQFTTVGEAFITAGTNGDKSKLTSAAYTAANDQLAAIVTTC